MTPPEQPPTLLELSAREIKKRVKGSDAEKLPLPPILRTHLTSFNRLSEREKLAFCIAYAMFFNLPKEKTYETREDENGGRLSNGQTRTTSKYINMCNMFCNHLQYLKFNLQQLQPTLEFHLKELQSLQNCGDIKGPLQELNQKIDTLNTQHSEIVDFFFTGYNESKRINAQIYKLKYQKDKLLTCLSLYYAMSWLMHNFLPELYAEIHIEEELKSVHSIQPTYPERDESDADKMYWLKNKAPQMQTLLTDMQQWLQVNKHIWGQYEFSDFQIPNSGECGVIHWGWDDETIPRTSWIIPTTPVDPEIERQMKENRQQCEETQNILDGYITLDNIYNMKASLPEELQDCVSIATPSISKEQVKEKLKVIKEEWEGLKKYETLKSDLKKSSQEYNAICTKARELAEQMLEHSKTVVGAQGVAVGGASNQIE